MATTRTVRGWLVLALMLAPAIARAADGIPTVRRMPGALSLPAGLTDLEAQAVSNYQSGSTVNFYLRYLDSGEYNWEVWDAETVARYAVEWEQQAAALDSALAKTRPIASPLEVFHVHGTQPVPAAARGGVFRDAGYLSTDPSRGWTKDFLRYRMGQHPEEPWVYMKIRVPAGSRLLDVQGIARSTAKPNDVSTELLIARGWRVRILRSHAIHQGKIIVQLAELLPPEAAEAQVPPRLRLGRLVLGRLPYTPSLGALLLGTALALEASRDPADAAVFAGAAAAWMATTHVALRGLRALGFRRAAARASAVIPIVGEVLLAGEVALALTNRLVGTDASWGDVWDAYTGALDRPTSLPGLPPTADAAAYLD